MISPTVGRIVLFFGSSGNIKDPLPAIVSHVWSDTCVNVAIFNKDGSPVRNPPTSVRLVQEGEERPSEGYFCEWMPYQIKKATGSESGELAAGTSVI